MIIYEGDEVEVEKCWVDGEEDGESNSYACSVYMWRLG